MNRLKLKEGSHLHQQKKILKKLQQNYKKEKKQYWPKLAPSQSRSSQLRLGPCGWSIRTFNKYVRAFIKSKKKKSNKRKIKKQIRNQSRIRKIKKH